MYKREITVSILTLAIGLGISGVLVWGMAYVREHSPDAGSGCGESPGGHVLRSADQADDGLAIFAELILAVTLLLLALHFCV